MGKGELEKGDVVENGSGRIKMKVVIRHLNDLIIRRKHTK
jgi:hypothetical protein